MMNTVRAMGLICGILMWGLTSASESLGSSSSQGDISAEDSEESDLSAIRVRVFDTLLSERSLYRSAEDRFRRLSGVLREALEDAFGEVYSFEVVRFPDRGQREGAVLNVYLHSWEKTLSNHVEIRMEGRFDSGGQRYDLGVVRALGALPPPVNRVLEEQSILKLSREGVDKLVERLRPYLEVRTEEPTEEPEGLPQP